MKECARLRDDDYLQLAQAEQDGLLTIHFRTKHVSKMVVAGVAAPVKRAAAGAGDGDDWDDDEPVAAAAAAAPASHLQLMSITDKLKSYYQKDEFSYNVQQWNSLRAEVAFISSIASFFFIYLFIY